MNAIFDFFNKLNNSETNEQVLNSPWDNSSEFELGLKQFEKLLNSNQDNNLLSDLESDTTFSNFSYKEHKDDLNIIKQSFENFSPWLNDYSIQKSNNHLNSYNVFNIMRTCDAIGKFYLRLYLKPNTTNEDISIILNLLADSSIEFQGGGVQLLKIPKFILIYLICGELDTKIKMYDTENFISQYTNEEIKNMAIKIENKKIIKSEKYFFKKNSRFIDIPLLHEFFVYGMNINLIASQFHDYKIIFEIKTDNLNKLENYIDVENVSVIADELIYYEKITRSNITIGVHENFKMQCKSDYYHNFCNQTLQPTFILKNERMKFMFIFISASLSEFNLINSNQLPQIQSIDLEYDLEYEYKLSNCSKRTIPFENMYFAQYENILVYGIALDGYSNMKNWIQVLNECNNIHKTIENKQTIEYKSSPMNLRRNTGESFSNLNRDQNVNPFGVVCLSNCHINFTNILNPINVEIYLINQNINRMISGMTGDWFYR